MTWWEALGKWPQTARSLPSWSPKWKSSASISSEAGHGEVDFAVRLQAACCQAEDASRVSPSGLPGLIGHGIRDFGEPQGGYDESGC